MYHMATVHFKTLQTNKFFSYMSLVGTQKSSWGIIFFVEKNQDNNCQNTNFFFKLYSNFKVNNAKYEVNLKTKKVITHHG